MLPETELAHRIHVRRISAYAQLNEMRRVIRRMEAAIVDVYKRQGKCRCCVGVLVQTTAPKARPLVQTRPFFIQNNSVLILLGFF